MYNVEQIEIRYEESDTVFVKGSYKDLESFFKSGYIKKSRSNGYFELLRPTRVFVFGNCGKNGCFLHEMKAAILAHYDKKKITMPITDQFNNDFKSGKKAKSCAVLVIVQLFVTL